MVRHILTTWREYGSPQSKSYTDSSAAVKDWMEFADRDPGDFDDWHNAYLEAGSLEHTAYAGEFMDQIAFLTRTEIY